MTTLCLALGATSVGCMKADDADDFRGGVPQSADVALDVPANAAAQGALTADGTTVQRGALLGDRADFYTLTRDVTVAVNGATAAVLGLVKTITTFPPSSLETDTAVWGPHTEPLSPNTWRLTVHRLAPGQFQYELEAKPKTADDSAYLTILSGHHNVADIGLRHPVLGRGFGSGDFILDWNKAQMLPEHDANVGVAVFNYSHLSPQADVMISVALTQVKDSDSGMLEDATYNFDETPSDGGNFQFSVTRNFILTTAAIETLTVRSRWMQTGAGRSDATVTGGDVGATAATASECWDSNFASVFMTNSWGDPAKMWGAESSCAFTTADPPM